MSYELFISTVIPAFCPPELLQLMLILPKFIMDGVSAPRFAMLNRLFSDPAFLALERAMDASAARSHLIAHNIANADTPNYKAKRLRFEEFLARELNVDAPMSELPLRQTRSDHLPGRTAYGSMVTLTSEGIIYTENTTTWRLDGNNVDIDHEMAEQAKNALQYSALSDLISRRLAGIRTAISEGRR